MKKILFLLPLFAFSVLNAQDSLRSKWTEIEFEKKSLDYYMPSYLNQFDSINIGNSTINYFQNNNHFKDVFTTKKSNGFGIQSERFATVNNWKFYGKFSFSKYEDKETGFTGMANPYRDNPYMIADSTTNADWKKQHYLIQAQIITPEITKGLRAGTGVKYEILNGARQIDPRPLDKSLDLNLTPFLLYNTNRWNFGINGYYNHYREDISISLENIQQPKNLYKLIGLGEYLYNQPLIVTTGLTRKYNGNSYGGGLTIGYRLNSKNMLQLNGELYSTKEIVTDGVSNPYKAGNHNQDVLKGTISYQLKEDRANHIINLSSQHRKSKNREYIQLLNPETSQYDEIYNSVMHHQLNNSIILNYDVLLKDDKHLPSWNLGTGLRYTYLDEQYPTTNFRVEINQYYVNGFAKKWFNLKKGNLLVGYSTTLKVLGDNLLRFTEEPKLTNFVAKSILYPNFAFETTGYWTNQFEVQYTLPAFRNSNSQLYFKINYQNMTSTQRMLESAKGLSNNYLNFTIGLFN